MLPAGVRSRKVQWEVPRKSNGWAYGFVKQIDEYDGENWIDFKSDWTIPSPEAEMQSLEKLIRMAKSKEGAQSGII